MSNFAALVDVLSVAGSRLSDGTPNSSGTVYFFRPGTNTPVNVYSDAAATTIITQPVTLNSGGLINLADFPNGIYVTQPVRVLVQDVNTNIVVDTTYIPASAGDVGVSNAGFTDSNLNDVLTKAFTSFGGQDWKYKESGGATSRTIKSKFAEQGISVKDFGAVGDGVADDTTAIQNAANEAKSLSTNLFLPAGTYKISQAITISSAHVSVRGESFGVTRIITSHATASIFSFASCSSFEVSGLRLNCSSSSAGAGIAFTDCNDLAVVGVALDSNAGALFLTAISAAISTGLSSGMTFEHCALTCQDDATARALKLSNTTVVNVVDSILHGNPNGVCMEFAGYTGDVTVSSTYFTGTGKAIVWTSGGTGVRFRVFGCPSIGTAGYSVAFDVSALSTLPDFRQWGNNVDAVAFSAAIGNTLTPVLYKGKEIILSATSGGAGTQTVAAPAILPGTGTTDVDLYWDFVFINASGGAVTWSTNAIYVLSGAVAVPATAAHTIQVRFRWDKASSKFRECSRGDTVT
jgi:hypothetical protein